MVEEAIPPEQSSAMLNAFKPEIRISEIAPTPSGLAIAAIVGMVGMVGMVGICAMRGEGKTY